MANPHANSRAEIGVKTVKRMLMENTPASGSLDVDKFQRALLVYRNSIDPETKASPAMIVFGRAIRDPIPIPMGRYCPHPTWTETLINREKALAKRHSREHEKWSEHTRALPPLKVGDHVYIQNLTGNNPKRWERTGVVVEVKQFHQYVIKIDGSGRLTLRNRQYLRQFQPFKPNSREEFIESFIPTTRTPDLIPVGAELPAGTTPTCGSAEKSDDEDKREDSAQEPEEVFYDATSSPVRSPQPPDDPRAIHTVPPEEDVQTLPASTPHNDNRATHTALNKKNALALRRLAPHNSPGTSEGLTGSRLRSRRTQH